MTFIATEIKEMLEQNKEISENYDEKQLALLAWLHDDQQSLDIDDYDKEYTRFDAIDDMLVDITQVEHDDDTFEADGGEYQVLTNDEAEEAWEEDLDNYIDECILHELPEPYRQYFDDEKWKRDAKYDGRGHSLNRYDGSEEEIKFNGIYYYIYRQN